MTLKPLDDYTNHNEAKIVIDNAHKFSKERAQNKEVSFEQEFSDTIDMRITNAKASMNEESYSLKTSRRQNLDEYISGYANEELQNTLRSNVEESIKLDNLFTSKKNNLIMSIDDANGTSFAENPELKQIFDQAANLQKSLEEVKNNNTFSPFIRKAHSEGKNDALDYTSAVIGELDNFAKNTALYCELKAFKEEKPTTALAEGQEHTINPLTEKSNSLSL